MRRFMPALVLLCGAISPAPAAPGSAPLAEISGSVVNEFGAPLEEFEVAGVT